jgi:hypothetical protein
LAYIGNQILSAAFLTDTFSGDGSTTAFTMTVAPATTSSMLVAISGVLQSPTSYNILGTTLTFTGAPPAGSSNISVRYLGVPASVVGGVAGGSNTQVQYNSGNSLAGSANMTFNGTTLTLANDASISGLTVGKGGGAGGSNTVVGNGAMAASAGVQNSAFGASAGAVVTGNNLTVFGYNAGKSTTTGGENAAFGSLAFQANTTGADCVAVGVNSLYTNTTGSYNTAVGQQALYLNTTASNNTAVGYQAGYSNTTGAYCSFVGFQAGYTSNANSNSCLGYQAGYTLTSGHDNTFLGVNAGNGVTTGSYNVIVGGYQGNSGGLDIRTASNYIVLSDGSGNPRQVIDSSGNVGIGTASPTTKLTVATGTDNANALNIQGDTTNNVMTLTNYQMLVGRESGSNGGLTIGTKSQTWGASGAFTAIATNGTERMRIDSSGNLLVGVTSAFNSCKQALVFNGATNIGFAVKNSDATVGQVFVGFYNSAGTNIGAISQNATTTVNYATSSDYRLKENVTPMTGALDTLAQLKPVSYTWIEGGESDNGFLAHELQTVLPNAVTGEKDAVNEDGTIKIQGVDYSKIVATLTAALQELSAQVTTLQAQVTALQGK